MTKIEKKAFTDMKSDYKQAKEAKSTIDKLIVEWGDLYDGKTKKSKTVGSKMVMKEVAKQVEYQKPTMMAPFVDSSHPIRIVNMQSERRARTQQKYLNSEFTGNFNRRDFMEQLTNVLLREGTVWVRTGWKRKTENNREIINEISIEELMHSGREPDKIEQNLNGTFKVEFNEEEELENCPTAKVCRNEHIFPDPSADTKEDCRFIAYETDTTISGLREQGHLSEEKLEKLEEAVSKKMEDSSTLGQVRNQDSLDYGKASSFQTKDVARQIITIVEYWGYYDLNGDGIAEPVIATWAKDGEINLSIEENPMPNKEIPFHREVYSARPFSLWGNPPAYFIGDNQIIKTGFMRGILDNMSNANNGQKFITRGSIDFPNFKKMKNGEKYIMVNKPEGIEDGSYNNLPPSVFATLQMVDQDTKQLTGIEPQGKSLAAGATSNDDKAQPLSMSQQKMSATVSGVAGLLEKVFRDWITMAEVFLSNEQIQALFSESDDVDIFAFKGAAKQNITVKVGTEIARNNKMQQMNMLMQQAKVLESGTPPETISELVAEMFETFDMYEKAEQIRTYKAPEPSKEQMMMQQLGIQKAQLEVQKLQAEIQDIQVQGKATMLNAQKGMIDAQAGAGYKQAQTEEKQAKAQGQRVDTALRPMETIQEMTQKSGDNYSK